MIKSYRCRVYLVFNDDIVNLMTYQTSWVIESGATIQAISRKEFFSSYTLKDYGVVQMGNDNLSKVIGKGDVCLMMENGMILFLREVRHISDMQLNLISAGRLDDEDVDDMSIVGQNVSTINSLKKKLSKSFAMKDLGPAREILGIKKLEIEMPEDMTAIREVH
ncbi:hypothetical protein GH714_030472 [Hevea brasiliensis]|uniref:Uncharacterized protein n=1 Tax=Hevea brasiliensis TaxID=3981 RepID=A0A6A6K7L9_HEVBR|nr:hypothetical protein GH714_030472 [Hevea brasiliensis]